MDALPESDLSPTLSERLGAFVANLRHEEVPEAVRRRAAFLMLDAVGAALASASFDFGRIAARALGGLETGRLPVIGRPERLSLRDAALVNGILVHGLDYDDTSAAGRLHPSSSCMPAALMTGIHLGSSGREVLTAYIAALETTIRLSAVAKGGFQRRGFHPTGVMGAFGGAFAAARLFGLDAAETATAQGIAYSTASGNQSYAATMAWTKRFHPGWGAAGGITAAALAKGGFVGPRHAYEGRFGLYAVYLGEFAAECDLSLATVGLGLRWIVQEISLKPLPACYFNVPLIDAAARIAAEHSPLPEEIDSVTVLVPEAAIQQVCEPVARKRRPTDAYAAQFSAFYTVAATLVRGRFGLDDLDDAALADERVAALAQRVIHAVDPHTTFPKHYSGAVLVTMRDGTRFEARETVERGSPERALTEEDILAKFNGNATRVLLHEQVERLRDAILGIERMDDVRQLAPLLAGPA
ncbi:MmgE/PrpD family protein [uncultured Enterovirga sp.]|uniref:MmgE/PrpD family protein n=1 Tax=uncultured Enterovirga sp. TaxID=2026352 RepID=UPI0035CAA737